jgi:hypothetical protein
LRCSIASIVEKEKRLVPAAPDFWSTLTEMRQNQWPTDAEPVIKLAIERFIVAEDSIAVDVCVERVVDMEKIGFAVEIVTACLDGEVNDTT